MTEENAELTIRCRDCIGALDWKFDSVFAPIQISVGEFAEQRAHLSNQLLSSTVKGMLIIYWFTVWEQYFSRSDEDNFIDSENLERLKAYRHIRHSAAHGMDLRRARQCRNEFESIMASETPILGVSFDQKKIDLSESEAAADCRDHLRRCVDIIFQSIFQNDTIQVQKLSLTTFIRTRKKRALFLKAL